MNRLASFVALLLVACAPAESPSTDGGSGGMDASTPPADASTPPADAAIDFVDGPEVRACRSQPTDECFACCDTLSGGGRTVYPDALLASCGCGLEAPCAAECTVPGASCTDFATWRPLAFAELACTVCLLNQNAALTPCTELADETCINDVGGRCINFNQCAGGCPAAPDTGNWVPIDMAPAACGPLVGSFLESCTGCEVETESCTLRCECLTGIGTPAVTRLILPSCTRDISNCQGILTCGDC